MYLPTRLLITALFALGILPAAIGQQPGTVNIRPRVAVMQAGVPPVRVTVDRNRVPLGDEVTFTLAPASIVRNPRFTVTIYFGDGAQQEMRQAEVVHLYRAPGNYTYSVLVKPSPAPPQPTPPSPRVPSVKLLADPTTVATNSSVSFTAQLSQSYPNLKYRFVFADGAQTDWQDASQTSHRYAAAKTYLAFVDVGEGSGGSVKRIGGSPRQPIQVTAPQSIRVGPNPKPTPSPRPSPKPRVVPPPSGPTSSPSPIGTSSATPDGNRSPDRGQTNSASPNATPTPSVSSTPNLGGPFGRPEDWWKYLLLALLVIFLGYQARYFLLPRPKFVPNLDPGVSRVRADKPLSIDFQVALDPNVAGGQYGIETHEGGLIKSERESNG